VNLGGTKLGAKATLTVNSGATQDQLNALVGQVSNATGQQIQSALNSNVVPAAAPAPAAPAPAATPSTSTKNIWILGGIAVAAVLFLGFIIKRLL
jgi:hypothetical protein